MQNTQNVIWWLEILKIVVPSAITLGVGYFLFQKTESYKRDLSKEIEDYKKDISKDLENYKFQLQSTFQTQFYQFQTKFSVLHQEQAKVIKELFAMLVDLDTYIFAADKTKGLVNDKNIHLFKVDEKERQNLTVRKIQTLFDHYDSLYVYYKKNRIFLSPDICESLDKILDSSSSLMAAHFAREAYDKYIKDEYKQEFEEEEYEKFLSETITVNPDDISAAIKKLENEFRDLMSVEIPNQENNLSL